MALVIVKNNVSKMHWQIKQQHSCWRFGFVGIKNSLYSNYEFRNSLLSYFLYLQKQCKNYRLLSSIKIKQWIYWRVL
jgi:hypothetical protein